MVLLSDAERSNIVFKAINEYVPGKKEIPITIAVITINTIINKKNQIAQTDSDEIYMEIIDIFNFFNDFIVQRKINVPKISEEYYKLVQYMINQAIEEVMEDEND